MLSVSPRNSHSGNRNNPLYLELWHLYLTTFLSNVRNPRIPPSTLFCLFGRQAWCSAGAFLVALDSRL